VSFHWERDDWDSPYEIKWQADWPTIEGRARQENWTFYRHVIVTVLAALTIGWVVWPFLVDLSRRKLLANRMLLLAGVVLLGFAALVSMVAHVESQQGAADVTFYSFLCFGILLLFLRTKYFSV
jgi:ACR3 family arsenite efflux pump ArsB